MVSLNKSFLYGICFASLTWVVSLYLFFQLTKSKSTFTKVPTPHSWSVKNNIVDPFLKYTKNNAGPSQTYVNSPELVKKLQPVFGSSKGSDPYEEELANLGLVRDNNDLKIKDEGYKMHAYNVLISNRLSLNRDIPDTRNKLCRKIKYEQKLPNASIIICFYNEHFHTLLRTIHSILNRTPAHLLEEIILVNDQSDIPYLHQDLDEYFKKNSLTKVRLFKPEKREGLIRARLFGARRAQGKVLVFLDSHVEVNVGWIEPLLSRIKEKQSNVVMPIIDIIKADTFAYSSSPLVRGGFNWGLHFKWENLPKGTLKRKEDFVKPIKSPTMAGGLFAIDRGYFIDMGEYDAGMNIWGGENLEISFRIWMCGGSIEIMPCSRVGHVFRSRRPYNSPDGQDTMLFNSLRVAYVWMDDYKEHFLNQRKDAKNVDYGDISSRLQLRKELKCHDFDWYLKNVYPELPLPTDDEEQLKKRWSAIEQDKYQPWHSRRRNYVAQYQIKLAGTDLCIQTAKDVRTKGSGLVLRPCKKSKNQTWYETDKNELVLAQLLCLQAGKTSPILYKCHEMGGDQEWRHKGGQKSPIYNLAAGTCLGVNKKAVNATVVMKLCGDPEPSFLNWDIIV
ncbi:hypothetical protein NQ315_005538 [Exocentrus adspersus]|uniref:Polypeptide N-acetylgalactosaminyltransferase n=1 Tax=Exocentrus adspersus TaxID=1586481 RepID=A0AAV8VTX4_9CUCU|nr:hypothetical protein NQ315_005538 [Exocentrus adspersus]